MLPPYLLPNDEIRIVSPSGIIEPFYIDGAKKVLSSWGFYSTEGEFCRCEYGRFAGTKEQRIKDLQLALDDTNVKAILCSRGGYGLAQIIDKLDFATFRNSPKWLIGFSDITILHNVITNMDIGSIHGIMAKHLTELPEDCEQIHQLKNILTGKLPAYKIAGNSFNRFGNSSGTFVGGNLSVLMGLRGSKYDLPYKCNILFIEDIAEKPYHIDRMMQNLRFSGVLSEIKGLVIGQFSECVEDELMKQSIAEIILDAVSEYHYPVCFNFPAGHVNLNLPLVLGSKINLTVNKEGILINY